MSPQSLNLSCLFTQLHKKTELYNGIFSQTAPIKKLLVSTLVANLKSVITSQQPFHLEEFISPLACFCLLLQQLVLHETVKTCSRPRFSCVFIFKDLEALHTGSAKNNQLKQIRWSCIHGGK